MNLICKLLGHEPERDIIDRKPYFTIAAVIEDSCGARHAQLLTECERCRTTYHIGNTILQDEDGHPRDREARDQLRGVVSRAMSMLVERRKLALHLLDENAELRKQLTAANETRDAAADLYANLVESNKIANEIQSREDHQRIEDAGELAACLRNCLAQMAQMKGMFDDEDGTISSTMADAELALMHHEPDPSRPRPQMTVHDMTQLVCSQLPEGYDITITLQNGYGGATMDDPEGKLIETDVDAGDEGLEGQIQDLLQQACKAQP